MVVFFIAFRWIHLSTPLIIFFFLMIRLPPRSTLFPYTTLFRPRLRPLRALRRDNPDRIRLPRHSHYHAERRREVSPGPGPCQEPIARRSDRSGRPSHHGAHAHRSRNPGTSRSTREGLHRPPCRSTGSCPSGTTTRSHPRLEAAGNPEQVRTAPSTVDSRWARTQLTRGVTGSGRDCSSRRRDL